MELGGTSAVISAVESGAGISRVSIWAAGDPLAEGRVGSIKIPALKANRQFGVVCQKGHRLTAPATAFRDFVLGRRAFLTKYARDLQP